MSNYAQLSILRYNSILAKTHKVEQFSGNQVRTMSVGTIRTLQRRRTVEWPTIALAAFIYAGWGLLTFFHAAIQIGRAHV